MKSSDLLLSSKSSVFSRVPVLLSSFLTIILFSPVTAFAEANAKEASNYILNSWIAPIFGVVVVYLVIKEFLNSKWIQGFAILLFSGIIYAVIKDPTGVLNSLSNLKSYFGL
ncbi:TcpD family membrane protein [Vagococcus fluvialis]|uniref:TcpD family membrane protein n=1 Tax=Vagococcus fluvialis TaxID=2738 RepID=UPI0037916F86